MDFEKLPMPSFFAADIGNINTVWGRTEWADTSDISDQPYHNVSGGQPFAVQGLNNLLTPQENFM